MICDFDVQLYGEGRTFSSLTDYWDYFGSVQKLDSQGCIWPGDSEDLRCATDAAYASRLVDRRWSVLLTSTGVYTPRNFPMPRASRRARRRAVQEHNRAQFYFGMFESTRHFFSDDPPLVVATAPGFRVSAYRNQVWGDVLIAVANLGQSDGTTSLQFPHPERLGFDASGTCWLVNADTREARSLGVEELVSGHQQVAVNAMQCRLLVVRGSAAVPCHVFGGKRICESWDAARGTLAIDLDGPPGLKETVLIGTAGRVVKRAEAAGMEVAVQSGVPGTVVRVPVQFGESPVRV